MRERVILVLAALVAFGASLGAGFHFDDYAIFTDPAITSPSGWWDVWRPLQTRPLTYFTFWLDYQLGGKDPLEYHVVNLLLHLGAVLLLYECLSRLLEPKVSLFAAALFAVHPIQAEAVAYIWARSSLLAAALCLLSLRAWLGGRRWTATAWFALALLAKEECVTFPLFLLLLERDLHGIAGMLVLAAAAGARALYATAVTPGAPAGMQAGISPVAYWLAQGPVIWRYLRLLVVPWGFTVDADIRVPPWWLGVIAWAAIAALIVLAGRRNWWLTGGFILLAASSSIFPAAVLAADRRMYLPMIAFAAAIALWVTRGHAWIVAALVVVSILRTQVWMSEKALWTGAVERAPAKLRPKLQLARASDPESAMKLLGDAKKIAPDNPAVASETGKTLLLLGRPQDALPEFGRALALSPGDAQAFNNRGVALHALGQQDAARRDFEHALALDPCAFDPRHNLLSLGIRVPPPPACRFTPEQQRMLH